MKEPFFKACHKSAKYLADYDEVSVLANHHVMAALPIIKAYNLLGDKKLIDGYNYFEITSRTTIDGSKADPETLQQIKEIIKSIVLLDPLTFAGIPNQTQAMIMASDLGVTESDIINNNIDFLQFKSYKKYQNTENNFSIEYPAEFVVVEDYDSAHGTTGHVQLVPESSEEAPSVISRMLPRGTSMPSMFKTAVPSSIFTD